jgi:hypothetical protein
MSEGFRTPPEELRHLLDELAAVRATLRDIGGRLAQIERHVKRAFNVPPRPTSSASSRGSVRAALPPPTLSPAQALSVFDELAPLLEDRGREAVEERLSTLGLSDLKLIAQELGAPLPRKPSRRALGVAILGRVNESRLLSRNRNVTAPHSASDRPGGEPPRAEPA